jgi:hypothetical protein
MIGGILACAFLLGFLLLAGLYRSQAGMTLIGLVFTGAAIFINRAVRHTVLETASIAGYISGLALAGAGLSGEGDLMDIVLLVCAAIALVTIFLTERFMLVFIPVLIIFGCMTAFILQHNLMGAIVLPVLLAAGGYIGISLSEPELLAGSRWMNVRLNALRAGFLGALAGLILVLGSPEPQLRSGWTGHISSVVMILAMLLLVRAVIRDTAVSGTRQQALIYLLVLLVLLPTFLAPAITGALLILMTGFHTSQRAALAAGLLLLIWSVSRYYYDLNLTLLVKSELMLASGALYLAAGYFLHRQLKQHAHR